ncbi:MAG: hypothetical protein KY432_09370 [Acidobacteria bacterium]|nr:hypothetical protein [Acidobacteriota bacterium]
MARAAEEPERDFRLRDGEFSLLAIVVGLVLASTAVVLRPLDFPPPQEFADRALLAAERVAASPTDRESFEILTQLALDLRNQELWKQSATAAQKLAPALDSPKLAFVRAGFLHWYTLDEKERDRVLATSAELFRKERHYRALWQPILQTTRDPAFLADHAPADPNLRRQLRDAAALWDDFATYRRISREFPVESRPRHSTEILKDEIRTTIPPPRSWSLESDREQSLVIEASTDEISAQPVMIEVWIDGMLREARVVDEPETIRTRVVPRDEIVEVRVANPRTRGGENRRVELTVGLDRATER